MDNRIIGYIDTGVVIDHLPVGTARVVYDILKLNDHNGRKSFGDGYESKKMGLKGILKIEGRHLSDDELNLISLVAQEANVSFIENGKVKSKHLLRIPERLEGLALCNNTNCISNDSAEKLVPVINYKNGIFSCHYCRYEFDRSQLRLNV